VFRVLLHFLNSLGDATEVGTNIWESPIAIWSDRVKVLVSRVSLHSYLSACSLCS